MSWIKTVSYDDAPPALRKLYDRVKKPDGYIDNILLVHGLRPHTLQGHMMLYKNVLHHQGNALGKWFLESIGVLVSHLNACTYCVEHHFAGLRKLLNDDTRAINIRTALEAEKFADAFTPAEAVVLAYVVTLTTAPNTITAAMIETLREAGYDDGMILEINQVASYFAYANRTVLGLGVSLKNDILGLSPGDSSDPENWSHA
ncbi:MAG: peroxidase-related enzyme [Bacteroidota bacterium]